MSARGSRKVATPGYGDAPVRAYYIESDGDDALIRLSGKRRYKSIRPLSSWATTLRAHGFFRIHRSYLVNLNRVREIRLRAGDTNDWEVKLDPPVNAVLPIGRSYYARLRKVMAGL